MIIKVGKIKDDYITVGVRPTPPNTWYPALAREIYFLFKEFNEWVQQNTPCNSDGMKYYRIPQNKLADVQEAIARILY
jgi:hypothetical protein